MISAIKSDPVIQESLATFKGSRISKVKAIDGKKWHDTNITVADLDDDLEAIYAVDTSKKAQEFRKQQRQNQLFIEKFIKQKNLK